MHPIKRHIASSLLTAALVVPIIAVPGPQEANVQVRVYDKDHKDYHNWDDKENKAWDQYLTENHHKHYEYSKANSRQQEQYWNWRHAHPDKDQLNRRNRLGATIGEMDECYKCSDCTAPRYTEMFAWKIRKNPEKRCAPTGKKWRSRASPDLRESRN